jgi:hypothetical protein
LYSKHTIKANHEYPNKIHERVVNVGPFWSEKTRAGTQLMEEEEALFSTQLPVITFGRLLLDSLPFLQLFRIRE